jgi:nitroimidazol reductase NimA-like FMN-containing flavoprotein (pyridoxamine 5'-phosphate oxidase superfamily)
MSGETGDTYGEWIGTPMAERDIDELLTSHGYGTLSLARDGDAYSLPISFGYAGASRLYFLFLLDSATNRKVTFAEATDSASLLIASVRGRFDWESVRAAGPIRRVDPDDPEWDDLVDAIDDNALFDSSYLRAGSLEDVQGWAMDVETLTGIEK